MKVLITGASGFVGQNLVPYLAAAACQISLLKLRNEAAVALNDHDAIIHLAGKAHDLKNVSNPAEYYEVNYELTQKLYDAFINSNASKFIFISSVKAAADQLDDLLTEDYEANPLTDYGKSKLMAEQYILNKPLPPGKSFYILRPCMIHGPGNKGNLNLLYQFVKKGMPYPLAAFNNKRSFLSVENLCFVIENLIRADNVPSGIYNVADDEALSTNALIEIMATVMQKNTKLWHIPKSLVVAAVRFGDALKMPLNSQRLQKLTETYVVSNTKIKVALGKKLPVNATDGIIATMRGFEKN